MNFELLFALIIAGLDPEEIDWTVVGFTADQIETVNDLGPDDVTSAVTRIVHGASAVDAAADALRAEGYAAVAYQPRFTAEQEAKLSARLN